MLAKNELPRKVRLPRRQTKALTIKTRNVKMSKDKAMVASPTQYPPTVKGYYAQAFKKTKEEKAELKRAKQLNKQQVKEDYGKEFSPEQLKKILNPRHAR